MVIGDREKGKWFEKRRFTKLQTMIYSEFITRAGTKCHRIGQNEIVNGSQSAAKGGFHQCKSKEPT